MADLDDSNVGDLCVNSRDSGTSRGFAIEVSEASNVAINNLSGVV